MANLIRDALNKIRVITYIHNAATTVDIIYLLAGMPMLAQNSELADVANIFTIAGLIEYAKATSQAWTGGQKVYWDDGNSKFTTVATGNTLAGIASEAAGSSATTGLIILMPELRDSLSKLPTASHHIVFAGSSTSETDADAEVVVTVTGAVDTDVAHATLRAAANAVYVTKAVLTADTLTITLSGNGGAGTIVDYYVCRAVI